MMQSVFRYLEPLGLSHECDRQTDGRTDFLEANAALSYVTVQGIEIFSVPIR